LIHYLHEFIMKNSWLSGFYIYWLKNILIKNFDWEIMTTNDLLLVWDMFLKIGEYGNVFENYKVLIKHWIDLSKKFKILLEEILMNKEFTKTSESELRFWKVNWRQLVEVKKINMDPEIAISLLLEKLELWQALTQVDYESIEELCKY
jgi:hypothetical protein